MKFYYIKNSYIDFLRQYDSRVLYNKNEARPYIGIVFEINGIKYYAPLASPKAKHMYMKNGLDFRKIDAGKLGAINLNNMLPVPDSALMMIHISDIADEKYRRLLNEQYEWLLRDFDNVRRTAAKLRRLFDETDVSGYKRSIKSRCCDFVLLESVYKQYDK